MKSKESDTKKLYPDIQSLMFFNKPAIKRAKAIKYLEEKRKREAKKFE